MYSCLRCRSGSRMEEARNSQTHNDNAWATLQRKAYDLARDAYLEKIPDDDRKMLRVLNFESMSLEKSKELVPVLFDRLIEQLYPGTTSTTSIVDPTVNS